MSETEEGLDREISRRERALWIAILAGLCSWVAWHMGAFDLTRIVAVERRQITVANVYAWVDHPFHATRAHLLLEALKNGEILRWVGSHQGGYPAEFYPLGAAWFDVFLWALLLGTQSIIAVHKLAVILVFLLPAVSYWILARGDGFHPSLAFVATAIHFAVPGTWLNGGYTELVGWGLITNVAGASLAFLASAALARFVLNRDHGMGVLAVGAAAAGACTNPRSLFALVIASAAILTVAICREGRGGLRARLTESVLRTGIVGVLALLLSAPVVSALFRYNSEYFFLHYQFYDPISTFWDASRSAVTLVVLLAAAVGVVAVLARRVAIVSQAMAVSLIGYVAFTAWVAISSWVPPLVEQLEAPRLMPFQRQLMIWLAAVAIGMASQWLASKETLIGAWRLQAIACVLIGLAFLVVFITPLSFVSEDQRSLSDVGTVGTAEFAEFRQAIENADAVHPQGSAIFVIGNQDDWWHEQLWAPTISDAPFYYDDWLWYWNTTHVGPFDYMNGTYYPDPSLALTEDYFVAHGIGTVVVTDRGNMMGDPRQAARSSELLAFVDTIGEWDVYSVVSPAPIITDGDVAPMDIFVENEHISASFEGGDGNVVIRRNWYPRWDVYADGVQVPVTHRADGYMEISVAPGPVEIDVRYGVTTLDWISRAASVVGAVGIVLFAFPGRKWMMLQTSHPIGSGDNTGHAGTIDI